jgi:hypothetical protein
VESARQELNWGRISAGYKLRTVWRKNGEKEKRKIIEIRED